MGQSANSHFGTLEEDANLHFGSVSEQFDLLSNAMAQRFEDQDQRADARFKALMAAVCGEPTH